MSSADHNGASLQPIRGKSVPVNKIDSPILPGDCTAPSTPTTASANEISMTPRGLKQGSFLAILSSSDEATPFWIGQAKKFQAQKCHKTDNAERTLISVRWYQATGSACDPFDALYVPAKIPRSLSTNADDTIWESYIAFSEVVVSFEGLTEENRLSKETVAMIKSTLYK